MDDPSVPSVTQTLSVVPIGAVDPPLPVISTSIDVPVSENVGLVQCMPFGMASPMLLPVVSNATLDVYADVLPGGRRAAIEKMAARLKGTWNPEANGQP